jgi:NAD(P)-dependent dehydrogenase (short-subunit alcohol dehydrogenase family)
MNNASAMPAIIKGAYGFDGEVVIVTGAARGIGEGIAGVLAQAGAMVIVADVRGEMAEERARTLRKAGHLADSVHLDIRRRRLDRVRPLRRWSQSMAHLGHS